MWKRRWTSSTSRRLKTIRTRERLQPLQAAGCVALRAANISNAASWTWTGHIRKKNKISFTAINVLKGEGKADGKPFQAGDSFFVPYGEKFTLEGKAEIVLTTEGKE